MNKKSFIKLISICLLIGSFAYTQTIPTGLFPDASAEDWNFKVLSIDGSRGHRHSAAIDEYDRLWPLWAAEYGFTLDILTDAAEITQANLADYDVVWLNNSTNIQDFTNAQQQAALIWYVEQFDGTTEGAGYGGIGGNHGATDMSRGAQDEWPWWSTYLGGVYDGAGGGSRDLTLAVDNTVPEWTIVAEVDANYSLNEEWYNWHSEPTLSNEVTGIIMRSDNQSAVWVNDSRKARSAWNAIGHNGATVRDDYDQRVLIGMLLYLSGYPDRKGAVEPISDKILNPSIGLDINKFNVEVPFDGNHTLNVFDVKGNEIISLKSEGPANYSLADQLDLGIYFVNVEWSKGSYNQKILYK